MPSFFIYSSSYSKENENSEKNSYTVTVIFCDRDRIDRKNLQGEIKQFYQSNYQTDEIFVIGGDYMEASLRMVFIDEQLETFKDIPKLNRDYLSSSLYLFVFNKEGTLKCINKEEEIHTEITKKIIQDGLLYIFKERGGLIEAEGSAHHFVFPSGKHCDKFLRTGNILLHSCEIYFIAFCILDRFNEKYHAQIYCDTSSINTLAFALLELKRKLIGDSFRIIPVESFSSYKGIFSKDTRFFENSLILVSSSTSGNIIDKIIQHHDNVDVSNVVILFFLGSKSDFNKSKSNILCNLTSSDTNPNGLEHYDTYTEIDCVLCKNGSYPVEVKGDVFLLEKPKINSIIFKVTDAPKKLSSFVHQFKASSFTQNNVLKANYKETHVVSNKYEVYFDMHHVLCSIEDPQNKRYSDFKEKLYNYLNQYIPSSTRYIITLPDEGSEKFADIVINHIKQKYKEDMVPEVIKFDEVSEKLNNPEIEGAVVILGSCIANGKNLLYLSRSLRRFDKLRIIYFIGLTRANNESYLDTLKSNLKQGLYGKENNSFIEIENLCCNKDSKNTSWLREKDFLLELNELIETKKLDKATSFFQNRIELINESLSAKVKGLSNDLFYPNTDEALLKLRKGFVFFNFTSYVSDISQADVYFTINTVINNLRNSNDFEHCLKQTEFVRNMIHPHNFNRFNDGVIQASILRSAYPSEICYHIHEESSSEMRDILEKIIDQHQTPQGEGLLEFLYAICIKKLTLKDDHLLRLSEKLDLIKTSEIVTAFNLHIKNNILSKKPTLYQQIEELKNENLQLKQQLNQ